MSTATLASILALSASCGGKAEQLPPAGVGVVERTGYLPYVEEVIVKQPLHEGEQIEVWLRVSSALYPGALAGFGRASTPEDRNRSFVFPFSELYKANSGQITGIHVEAWVQQLHPEPGGVSDSTTLYFEGLAAGSYKFQISSTDSPEIGGTQGECIVTPWVQPPTSEHFVYREYPFTVLPAEAAP